MRSYIGMAISTNLFRTITWAGNQTLMSGFFVGCLNTTMAILTGDLAMNCGEVSFTIN
jgi:hypothetical protein